MMGGFGGGMGGRGGGFRGAGGFGMPGQGAVPADANSAAPEIISPEGQRGPGMRGRMGQGGNAGFAGGAGRGGARGGGMGGGFNMANQIFRAIRIPADHPALKGKDLVLGKVDAEK